jgi:hypothetical protein
MGNKLVLAPALILAFSLPGFAQSKTTTQARGVEPSRAHSSARAQTVEELAKAVADAFAAGELARLDSERPYLRTVRIRVEHSITGDVVTRSFRSLERLEQWLKSRERGDGPARNGGTLRRCRRGVCAFEQEGMLHNNLYLQRITYGMARGRPYVKAIHLIDGD